MAKNILVADDEYGIRILLQEILQSQGYGVYFAETGQEALEIVDTQLINLIIIDYHLPVLNGVQVLEKLRGNGVSVPAILISGMFRSGSDEGNDFSLANSFLAKPFDVNDLCEQVALHIA